MYTTPSARWHATSTRDPASSTSFVYAVRTTHIFCRPTCKARLARRCNVTFYDNAAEAVAAGFRACKRCKPLLEGGWEPEREVMRAVCGRVEGARREGREVGLSEMAGWAGLSRWHFWRSFRRVVGCTPGEWVGRGGGGGREGGQSEGVGGRRVCYYATFATGHGVLLVAFLLGRICRLDLAGSEDEARGDLEMAFPREEYCTRALLSHGEMYAVAAQVAEAVERPSGRTLRLSLADGVFDGVWAGEGRC